jgi:hypothetical protein
VVSVTYPCMLGTRHELSKVERQLLGLKVPWKTCRKAVTGSLFAMDSRIDAWRNKNEAMEEAVEIVTRGAGKFASLTISGGSVKTCMIVQWMFRIASCPGPALVLEQLARKTKAVNRL